MGYPSYVQGGEGRPAEKHWLSMPPDLKAELLAVMENYASPVEGELDGICCWYDQQNRTCKHHAHRPNVCRDFQVGGDDCLGWREHYRDRIG
ncbi:MAG: hypothetical protein HKN47_26530 [Pirellulaceae bacterium]|nr:hypothetical protein [Pirellulaceae bacterium]